MRYSGGGIGHQHESTRWKTADRSNEANEKDLDPDPYVENEPQDSVNTAQPNALPKTTVTSQGNEGDSETNSSDSGRSSSSDSSEDLIGYGTDDDEEERLYFGPEDDEPTFDYDSDDI